MVAPAPALIDDYSPRWVGDLARPLIHQFVDNEGEVFDLTGVVAANMTFHMRPHGGGTVKVGLGTWTIASPTDAANGVASYAWHANDVNTAGLWDIQAGVPFTSTQMQHFSIREIEFLDPI